MLDEQSQSTEGELSPVLRAVRALREVPLELRERLELQHGLLQRQVTRLALAGHGTPPLPAHLSACVTGIFYNTLIILNQLPCTSTWIQEFAQIQIKMNNRLTCGYSSRRLGARWRVGATSWSGALVP